jgi:selenocysteine-specific elongation factor
MALASGGDNTLWLHTARWQQLGEQVLGSLARLHERQPDEPGVNAARLRRMALPELPADGHTTLWRGLLDHLLQTGQLAQTGAWLHLPAHRLQLSAQEEAWCAPLRQALEAGHFDPPWVRDLARGTGASEDEVRQLLRKLARQGQVFQVVKDLFYAPSAMAELAALAAQVALASSGGDIQAHTFRDATGLGRKRAIQILEFMDRVGHTRRVRDVHLLRSDTPWGPLGGRAH